MFGCGCYVDGSENLVAMETIMINMAFGDHGNWNYKSEFYCLLLCIIYLSHEIIVSDFSKLGRL